MQGTLNSLATTQFRIEFFVNDACDASGNGEGQTSLGSANVTTNGSGDATINTTIATAVAAGKFITATATRLDGSGNPVETSEFSACQTVIAPTLTINDVTVTEGNSGITNAVFTLTLTGAQNSCVPVTVNYATADGTATAGSDYSNTSGTLTFNTPHASNSITQMITVPVNGDLLVEGDETFLVNLSGASGATITDSQGQGTITNDDTATLSINDVSVAEGSSGTANATFTVSLSNPSLQTVTVQYQTANNTATAPSDYTAHALTTLTFNPSEQSKTVTVAVNGDTTVEANETFVVNLSNATNATISDAQGIGTITNDDSATIAINDVTVTEGNSGTVNAMFSVTLSNPVDQPVVVNYATTNNTATTADNDYAMTSGTVTFPANSTTAQTITVAVNGDVKVEANETFNVNLTPNSLPYAGVTIADNQGVGTITNDDLATFSITDAMVTEGNSGTVNAVFMVTLTNPSDSPITVNFATADQTATVANNDYTATSGTVTFLANSTAPQTITVLVKGDTAIEPDETFLVNLSNAMGATIADAQGIGTIKNDDGAAPVIRMGLADPGVCLGPGNLSSPNDDRQQTHPTAIRDVIRRRAPCGRIAVRGLARVPRRRLGRPGHAGADRRGRR